LDKEGLAAASGGCRGGSKGVEACRRRHQVFVFNNPTEAAGLGIASSDEEGSSFEEPHVDQGTSVQHSIASSSRFQFSCEIDPSTLHLT